MIGHKCLSVVFEGTDSLGKSLQTQRVVDYLTSLNYKVTRVKSPYNDGLTYAWVYRMLENGWARKYPNFFQWVQFLNKLIFRFFFLPSLLRNNDFIIFDRWNISMWAYGVADGANETMTEMMLDCIPEPDFTILLDGNRHVRDTVDDSYEADHEYQRVVRSMYLYWATGHGARDTVAVVNANQPVGDVTGDIIQHMYERDLIKVKP